MQLLFIAALFLAAVVNAVPGSEQPGKPKLPPNHEGPHGSRPGPFGSGGQPGKPNGPPNTGDHGKPNGTTNTGDHGKPNGTTNTGDHGKPNRKPNPGQPSPPQGGNPPRPPRQLGQSGKQPGPMKDTEPHKKNPDHRGPDRNPGKPNGPPKRPLDLVFSPVFKVDNVTLKNTTSVPLKQGENLFLMPQFSKGEAPPHQGESLGPPLKGQYVKLIYNNSTAPAQFSIEFGDFKHGEVYRHGQ